MDRVEKRAPWRAHDEWRESAFVDDALVRPAARGDVPPRAAAHARRRRRPRAQREPRRGAASRPSRTRCSTRCGRVLATDPATVGRDRARAPLPGRRVLGREDLTVVDVDVRAHRGVERATGRGVRGARRRAPVGTSGPVARSRCRTGNASGDPAPGGVGAIRRLGRPTGRSRSRRSSSTTRRTTSRTPIVRGLPVRGYHADIDLARGDRRRDRHPLGGRVRAQGPGHRRALRRDPRAHRARLRDVGRRGSRTPTPRSVTGTRLVGWTRCGSGGRSGSCSSSSAWSGSSRASA